MASDKYKPFVDGHLPYCPIMAEKYEKLAKIGQGTFGEVYKGRKRNCQGQQLVAMKKVLMDNEKEGFPITALREIKILQHLDHKNIVQLLEICHTQAGPYNRYKSTFYLIFEYCDYDLAGLLNHPRVKLSVGDCKNILCQLLNGLFHIHAHRILHRDMKAANILLNREGVLKLADFGLSRPCAPPRARRHTNRVVTLWYRPPELLLGERDYGAEIDMWGVGCIMAEMWTRKPLLQGRTEQHQLSLITELCGSLSEEVWPGVSRYELFQKLDLPQGRPRQVRERMGEILKDKEGVELIDQLLCLVPSQRINCDSALSHNFFWVDPLPSPSLIPLLAHLPPLHELGMVRKPQQQARHHAAQQSAAGRPPSQQSQRHAARRHQHQHQQQQPYPARQPRMSTAQASGSQLCDPIF
ncbi:P-TEFb-associated cyclin-dependent protein kinase Cdk9 [Nucella lapillus]